MFKRKLTKFAGIFYLVGQCCGSGMFIRIPETTKKEEGKNKLVVLPFLVDFPSIVSNYQYPPF